MKKSLMLKMPGFLIGSIFAGMLALLLIFAIPEKQIAGNVEKSLEIFEEEGASPLLFQWCESFLDNYTDAIMLHNACYEGTHGLVDRAMMVYRCIGESMDSCESLIAYIRGDDSLQEVSYARYWHGYLILLRPLLFVFSYGQIRMINLAVQTFLNAVLIFLLYHKGWKKYIIPYLFAIFAIMPLTTAFSLQFSSVFYIMASGSILLLLKYEKWKANPAAFILYFMMLGILTSFLDFLTYPLATLGIPLGIYLVLDGTCRLKKLFVYLFSWGFGYVGMWGGKWVTASVLTGENIIGDAIKVIGYRSSMGLSANEMDGAAKASFSFLDIMIKNVGALMLNHRTFIINPVMLLFVLYVLGSIVAIAKRKRLEQLWKSVPCFLAVILLPFAWYMVASNHSYLHFWFTYKELMISVFGVSCLLEKAKQP